MPRVPALKRRAIAELQADPRNARFHPERNVQQIAASLERFGQLRPILVTDDGRVIAGNGTLQAATSLGWTDVLCMTWTGPDDDDAIRAYAIVDNRTAELATWDAAELVATQAELDGTPWADLGFKPAELQSLAREVEPPSAFKREDSDAHLQYRCPKCGHTWGGTPS